jgi:starvation-inducible DNA-binding protein
LSVFEHPQAEALDGALADLVDLGLLARHARWNLVGPGFQAVRTVLDELVELARRDADRVGERAATLGHPPDGRAATVSRLSSLPRIDPGAQHDRETIAEFVTILDALTSRIQSVLEAFDNDLVTVDLFTGVLGEVERHAWTLRAQQDE